MIYEHCYEEEYLEIYKILVGLKGIIHYILLLLRRLINLLVGEHGSCCGGYYCYWNFRRHCGLHNVQCELKTLEFHLQYVSNTKQNLVEEMSNM